MPTWWQVSSRAVHTNTPDTPLAKALVRKSWGPPCEPLSTRSICGPAATVGMAGGGLRGSQVADTRGAPAVFRNSEALLICRRRQRSEDSAEAQTRVGVGGAGAGQEVGKAMWVSPGGQFSPLAVSARLAITATTLPIISRFPGGPPQAAVLFVGVWA